MIYEIQVGIKSHIQGYANTKVKLNLPLKYSWSESPKKIHECTYPPNSVRDSFQSVKEDQRVIKKLVSKMYTCIPKGPSSF